jgi:hypothetical protein
MNGLRKYGIYTQRNFHNHDEEWNVIIHKQMDGTGEHHSEQGYWGPEDQKSYVLPHIQTLDQGQTQLRYWTNAEALKQQRPIGEED